MTRPSLPGEIQCPNCETRFSLDLSNDTVEADEEE